MEAEETKKDQKGSQEIQMDVHLNDVWGLRKHRRRMKQDWVTPQNYNLTILSEDTSI